MERPTILLMILLLCGCDPSQVQVPGHELPGDAPPLAFAVSKAGGAWPDAAMSEFHYLTYDYNLGSWSGELGGTAVLDEARGSFHPSDAMNIYWPEGKRYAFFAAGYNENLPVSPSVVEFGSGMMLYSSGSSALLSLRNPGHDVDWLAGKALQQASSEEVPLCFRHILSRISGLRFDLSDYKAWMREKELETLRIESMGCSLSDVDEQVFIFTMDDGNLFLKESWDYTAAALHTLDGRRRLDQTSGAVPVEYYAFPGTHCFRMRFCLLNRSGTQVVDDRMLSGNLTLPMGSDCELRIKIVPDDGPLCIEVAASLPGWNQGGEGTVSE